MKTFYAYFYLSVFSMLDLFLRWFLPALGVGLGLLAALRIGGLL